MLAPRDRRPEQIPRCSRKTKARKVIFERILEWCTVSMVKGGSFRHTLFAVLINVLSAFQTAPARALLPKLG